MGAKASDEGVQNDLLPLLDGTDVPVKEGREVKFTINTRNILFVALGAFVKKKPSDLITEIQGRLPIQVSVETLKPEHFKQILCKSRLSTLNYSVQLLRSEGINIEFTDEAINKICKLAYTINQTHNDTGARRLVSVIDQVLEEINFCAPELVKAYEKDGKDIFIKIDENYVAKKCEILFKGDRDIKKNII